MNRTIFFFFIVKVWYGRTPSRVISEPDLRRLCTDHDASTLKWDLDLVTERWILALLEKKKKKYLLSIPKFVLFD